MRRLGDGRRPPVGRDPPLDQRGEAGERRGVDVLVARDARQQRDRVDRLGRLAERLDDLGPRHALRQQLPGAAVARPGGADGRDQIADPGQPGERLGPAAAPARERVDLGEHLARRGARDVRPGHGGCRGGERRGVLRAPGELDARFSELYRTHLRDVYSYSYYRVGNHHDAEDLTEQTFLQAYRHFERALRESNGRPLRPWLIRIAHNLAANFYRDRSRKPESAIEDAGIIASAHTTESLVEGREELKAILAGVQQLPDDRREALIMRFALGMDNREIARALGRTDGATKVLLHRAIRQLEGIVSDEVLEGVEGK